MSEKDDILAAFDLLEEERVESLEISPYHEENTFLREQNKEILEDSSMASVVSSEAPTENKTSTFRKISAGIVFLIKYISTSLCIFGVLLVGANYSAYSNLIYSFLYAEEMEKTSNSLVRSVEAAEIENSSEKKEVNTFKQLEKESEKEEIKSEYIPSMHSLGKLIAKTEKDSIDLGIEITPYENRIIIPKIGKNIPLLDITQQTVTGVDELNDIFMKELENGVIRYPGSAKPGEEGNSFIFGHSSNFPWLDGDYNDVFALLDNVVYDDEVIIYYGQEKHTYKIQTKNVIRPGDVSILKKQTEGDRSKVTLMTCWPIGTTLNRLVLTGELISVE